MVGNIPADDIFEYLNIFSYFFPEKGFDNVETNFLGEIKRNIINVLSAEFSQRVVQSFTKGTVGLGV